MQLFLSTDRSLPAKLALFGVLVSTTGSSLAAEPIDIGTRRELFVDRFLIDQLHDVQLRLHHPVKAPRPRSPLPERHYITIIRDVDRFRAYWRDKDPEFQGPIHTGNAGELVRYAESEDGHDWTFPKLGIHEIGGSRDNNVVLARLPPLLTNFTPFLDTRPNVQAEQRYKALGGYPGPGDKRGLKEPDRGLFAFTSPDGIHWTKGSEVIPYQPTWRHAFDSQNVSFWSQTEQKYVCYFRTWTSPGRLRSISRTTSDDFAHWTQPIPLDPNLPGEHLYTNQTHPYYRAPHIYIALPTRFVAHRGDSPAYDETDVNATDILLMTTRAGSKKYDRLFTEAFIRPGMDPDRWRNRANYVALNVVPTGPNEMSIYHRSGDRYVLRADGFASVHAGGQIGELLTKPVRFTGELMRVNLSTSALGTLRVELQDENGQPWPGFELRSSNAIYGDGVDLGVAWKQRPDVSSLIGKPVRIRFVLQDGDLYSFRFQTSQAVRGAHRRDP